MKVSLNWLREFVQFDLEPRELAERLTFAGLEVEAIGQAGIDLAGIVAGEIMAIGRHPNAEKLLLCQVNDCAGTVRVVCGARNFQVGDKVPLARPGAVLAGGMQVKPAVIRGENSDGVLCAPDELGVTDDHQGLMLLPHATPAGTPLADIIGPPDHVLTIEVTPNRPDCLSMIGIAREVAALLGCRLKRPAVRLPKPVPSNDADLQVQVEDAEGCPRYVARQLTGVKVKPSPWWLCRRLFQAGIRPINNVVDITNYVMLECGQPLHAFDRALLAGMRIDVRRAKPGEVLNTLDEIPRKLTPEMLVIADGEKAVALAGVMGGVGSGISQDTTAVVLESACFRSSGIRRTSRVLGLSTESSCRFERGVDILTADWASRRAAALMIELADARLTGETRDVFPDKPGEREIECRFDHIRRMLGLDITDKAIKDIFKALELKVKSGGKNCCVVCVPSFRPDLEGEADLAEEVARLHGLDNIPLPPVRIHHAAVSPSHRHAMAVMRLRAALAGLGLSEIMNYSFTSERLLNLFGSNDDGDRRVLIPNPVSADHAVLRDSLLPQMLETLGRNRAHQVEAAAFFEIGRVFGQAADGTAGETEKLAVGLMGSAGRPIMDQRRPPDDEESLLWLKGILENICRMFKFDLSGNFQGAPDTGEMGLLPLADAPAGFVWPARGSLAAGRGFVVMLNGSPAGIAGLVKPELRLEWRINEPLALLEVMTVPLLAHIDRVSAPVMPPVYPAVQRDLAMLAPRNLHHTRVLEVIRQAAPLELTDARLFDIFEGKQIGMGCKSMAYTLIYRSRDKTLTDEEVNAMHAVIIGRLRDELKVEIRVG